MPSANRFTTSQILNVDEQYIMIDCGEGAQIRLMQLGLSHFRIQTILISHMHGDHYFGLLGLVSSMALAGRQKKLELIGPPQIKEWLDSQLSINGSQLPFEVEFTALSAGEVMVVKETAKLRIMAFPTLHSIPCHGFRIDQIKPKYRLLPEKCEAEGIPFSSFSSIKSGQDYVHADGRVVSFTELTEPIPFTNYSYAYSADTLYNPDMVPYIEGVHTLYHESTYCEDRKEKTKEYKHSTAKEAASIAKLAKVERLILGHYSSAYKFISPFLRQAEEVFPNTELSEDGYIFHWPSSKKKS